MNRYELGHCVQNFELVEAFAKILNVPAPYFYARDEQLARLLLASGRMKVSERAKFVEGAEQGTAKQHKVTKSRSG